jgi:uncharacterized protein YbaP (TraB family)
VAATRLRIVATLVALATAVCFARAQPAAAPDAAETGNLDAVIVTGERAGPRLWQLRRGDAQLWILGALSPLPKDITWRSSEVERVVTTATSVVIGKPLEIGFARALWIFLMHHDLLVVPDGRRLHDVLPPPLYARFAAQRANYTHDPDKWERYRPALAAAFLEETAFRQAGLSTRLDMGAAVRQLADKHDVRVDEVATAGVRDLLDTLKTVPPATENKCLAAALSTIETGLPRLVQRARAWSRGDISGMQGLPDSAEDLECRAALTSDAGSADLLGRIRREWLEALDAHVRGRTVTLAVVHFDLLLDKGGLLDQLQARGYTLVDAP